MPLLHDQFFRRTFAHADQVAAFLRGVLHPKEVATIKLDTLDQVADTFISPQLADSFADVVWQCETCSAPSAKSEKAYLCILIEHKAQPTTFPYPQLLLYIAGIWERQHRLEKRIHPILPILFHQGKRAHRHRPLASWLKSSPEWLRPLTPMFDYRLCDLRTLAPEALPSRFRHPELQLEMTAMKWASEGLPSHVLVGALARVPREWPLRELTALKTYIEQGDLHTEDLDLMADLRPEPERRELMTLRDRLIDIGVKKGLEEGHELGLAEGLHQAKLEDAHKMKEHGIAVEVIAEITGLSPEQIATL